MDVVWKLVAAILNRRLTAYIAYHNFLHGLWAGRGTGTSTLEAKLLHQLEAMREEFMYVIFLGLHKSCEALDRERCLEIMKGYGVGHQACRILRTYWDRLRMVTRARGYYRKSVKCFMLLTKEDHLSPTIFSVVLDAVVRHWVE